MKQRPPMTHDIKTHREFFDLWITRQKSFEVRLNDRDYRSGDTIRSHELDPATGKLTGRVGIGNVVYVLEGFKGLAPKFCVVECPFLKMVVKHHGQPEADLNGAG